jgi:hypothetical protein
MTENHRRIATLLGGKPADFAFLSALDDAAAKRLAADMESAKKAHSKHLRERMEEALGHLPMLLRIPMRKLFGL